MSNQNYFLSPAEDKDLTALIDYYFWSFFPESNEFIKQLAELKRVMHEYEQSKRKKLSNKRLPAPRRQELEPNGK